MLWQPAHPDWRPLPDVQVTLGGELRVGGADRAPGHPEVAGQGAGRGQHRAQDQAPVSHGLAQCVLNAVAQALGPVQAHEQVHATGPIRIHGTGAYKQASSGLAWAL